MLRLRGGSVRLIGDDQQLAAVGAGGALRDIAREVGALAVERWIRAVLIGLGLLLLAARGAVSLADLSRELAIAMASGGSASCSNASTLRTSRS